MLRLIWIIPALTFVAFWLTLFFGKRLPGGGWQIGTAAVGTAFLLSIVAGVHFLDQPEIAHTEPATHVEEPAAEAVEEGGEEGAIAPGAGESATAAEEGGEAGAEAEAPALREPVETEIPWFTFGEDEGEITAGTHVDGFTIMMLFTVTLISLLVHVFSTNYMHDDVRFTHFFAFLSLFTTGMLVLVVSSTTLQQLIGWELMGLCSFGLIGHWWEKKENSDAAIKAFLTTRTGDVGLLIGIVTTFFAAGQTFDIDLINERALNGEMSETALVVAAIALLVGVIGKSAQFPLHTWLPDAMAGPTPVSALIHAATMVVAGVYLLARLYGVFVAGFDIVENPGINLVAIVGGVTVLIAAALAFVQRDIKKVLAYSTVSQLGYMVMALGVGAWTAAIFHLFTHAFFKGLLFLGSGSVSHAVHSFDMKSEMGGLRKFMPITFATFMVGSLALAGVFPLAGFWSKDEILLGAGENGYELFEIVGLAGAFMTAAYMTRCVYLTFFGEYRGHGHPHESPPAITVPLIVLAVFSVGAGLLNAPFFDYAFAEFTLNETVELAGVVEHEFSVIDALISTVVAVAGIAVAYAAYFLGRLPEGTTSRSRPAALGYRFLANKYYLDHLYTGIIIGSIKGRIARAAYWFNQKVLDGVVNGVAAGARRFGEVLYDRVDQGGIDRAVNATGTGAGGAGGFLRTFQTGRVQQYGALLFGAATLLAFGLALLAT
ncbi:MAG: NADH-quinone oxidoreductase subunit L [Acidimicrobiia bacterium]|nr:NADH-quinone oxidoreductase subunit L [Acidimicrobiia bacterium]